MEKEISLLEEEKSALESQLGSDQLSPDELINKSERIGIILKELDTKTNRWLELLEKE